MSKTRQSERLQRVSEAPNAQIANWCEGVSLSQEFGRPIDELLKQVVVARWRLASEHLRDGRVLMRSARPVYRSVISRFYYAMYHAFRAATFLYHRGDDHQSHSQLPTKLPDDMTAVSQWKTTLKNARLVRNRADYDAYPRSASHWRAEATRLRSDAGDAVVAVRAYLRAKGCRL